MVLPLGLSIVQNLAVILFVAVCSAIVLIVLIQKGRGGGIGAAFGGGGAGSLLGTKTGDFLTWVTICLVAAFLVLAILMGKFMRPSGPSDLTAPVMAAPAESAPATDEATPAVTPADVAAETEVVVDEATDAAGDAVVEVEEVVEDTAAETGEETN